MNKPQFKIGDRFRYKIDIGDFKAGDIVTLMQQHPFNPRFFRTDVGSVMTTEALADDSVMERLSPISADQETLFKDPRQHIIALERENAALKQQLLILRGFVESSVKAAQAAAEQLTTAEQKHEQQRAASAGAKADGDGEVCPDCGEVHPQMPEGLDAVIRAIMGQALPEIMDSMDQSGHNVAKGEVPGVGGGKLSFTVIKIPRAGDDTPEGVTKH